jgi:hypothetical protein
MISSSKVNKLTRLGEVHPEKLESSSSLPSGFPHSPVESFQHVRPPLRREPLKDFHVLSPFGHLRGFTPLFCGNPTSTFLHPFAPQALPCIHATTGTLTPARLALRTLIRGIEHQPFSGQVSLLHTTRLSMHSVTNHPTRPVIAFTLSTQRDRLPESALMGSPGGSGLDFAMNELARRSARPKRVRHPTDCLFASGCSPPRLTTTQSPSATGSGHLPEGTFTPKARLLGGALIPAQPAPEIGSPGAGIQCLFRWLKSLEPGFRRDDDHSRTDWNFVDKGGQHSLFYGFFLRAFGWFMTRSGADCIVVYIRTGRIVIQTLSAVSKFNKPSMS